MVRELFADIMSLLFFYWNKKDYVVVWNGCTGVLPDSVVIVYSEERHAGGRRSMGTQSGY